MSSRSIASVALLLVLTTACDQSKSSVTETPTATVSITLGLSASEIGAATVEFFVSHPTALPQPITGTVPVADPVTSFTLTQIPVVALGDPYTLSLIAEKTDGTWVCEGNTTFDHDEEGATTTVSMTLTCPTSDTRPNGEVGVDVTFELNFCPVIEEISSLPADHGVGRPRRAARVGERSGHYSSNYVSVDRDQRRDHERSGRRHHLHLCHGG